jgi:alpha-ketoglutarate-dependent taurine dioxygenase
MIYCIGSRCRPKSQGLYLFAARFTMPSSLKAHTDWTRFGNATRIFSFQKQIKPSTDKNFTRYADQIAEIA